MLALVTESSVDFPVIKFSVEAPNNESITYTLINNAVPQKSHQLHQRLPTYFRSPSSD